MFKVRMFEARTLSWWADQRSLIDFEPPYQRRGGLWSRRDKAFLIDSILNEYDIPKLYIADFTLGPTELNPHNRQYAVIDGKQRFEAILDFLDGRLTLDKDFVFLDDGDLKLGGLGYKDLKALHPRVASRFDNFNLTVMSVITDEEGKINELFVRLNRNKTLTGPEIRNAMQGVVPELIRSLAERPLFQSRAAFSIKRGADLDIAAKFLLSEFRGRVVDTKRASLDRLVEEGVNADADADAFTRTADSVLSTVLRMETVFVERDPLLGTQGALVPYYWLIRDLTDDLLTSLRPFLVRFQEARAANRRMAADRALAEVADPELLEYERWNRSINDQGSIEGRLHVLRRRFEEFRETGEVRWYDRERIPSSR